MTQNLSKPKCFQIKSLEGTLIFRFIQRIFKLETKYYSERKPSFEKVVLKCSRKLKLLNNLFAKFSLFTTLHLRQHIQIFSSIIVSRLMQKIYSFVYHTLFKFLLGLTLAQVNIVVEWFVFFLAKVLFLYYLFKFYHFLQKLCENHLGC